MTSPTSDIQGRARSAIALYGHDPRLFASMISRIGSAVLDDARVRLGQAHDLVRERPQIADDLAILANPKAQDAWPAAQRRIRDARDPAALNTARMIVHRTRLSEDSERLEAGALLCDAIKSESLLPEVRHAAATRSMDLRTAILPIAQTIAALDVLTSHL